jgi:hypothetical protein
MYHIKIPGASVCDYGNISCYPSFLPCTGFFRGGAEEYRVKEAGGKLTNTCLTRMIYVL